MSQLVITHATHESRTVELTDDEYVLGRDPQLQIPLKDRKVSRRHARIFRRSGSYYIEDLQSVNGVLVGGQPLEGARKMNPGVEYDVGGFGVKLITGESRDAVTFTLTGRVAPVRDQVFMLPMGELEVGRVEGAAIVIPDVSVSRTHAVLTVDVASVTVEDLSSSNGTFVNGVKIGRRELRNGDTVRFGNIEFKFGRAGSLSLARARGLWASLANADTTVKIAASIGGLAVILLVVVLVIAISRSSNATPEGLSQGEARWARLLDDELLRAREEMRRGNWEEAQRQFLKVRDSDPVNLAAIDGLARVEDERKAVKDLEEARQALGSGNIRRALDLSDSVPARAVVGKEAANVAQSARALLANDTFNSATLYCKDRNYARCRDKAIEHLRYKPQSPNGKAMLAQAEESMRTAKQRFTPYTPPSSPEEVALQARYPDDELRDIVLAYMAGNVSMAIDKARGLQAREGASRLLTLLVDLQRTRDTAELAVTAGESLRVVHLLEHALSIDAKIMPAAQSSVVSANLQRRIAAELYELGNNAQIRGDVQEAFLHWSKASYYAPADENINRALAKLEAHADEELQKIDGTDSTSCAKLQSIMSLTRPESSVHLAAKSKHNDCK